MKKAAGVGTRGYMHPGSKKYNKALEALQYAIFGDRDHDYTDVYMYNDLQGHECALAALDTAIEKETK